MGDFKDEIDGTKSRKSYLITYSQADLQKFPTRESFGKTVAAAFSSSKSKVVPQHWACCMEKHSDGGYHFHVSLKLSGTKKWLETKRTLETQHRISVHFSHHDGYYSAYWYISKYDENIFHSTGHPNLDEVGSPRTLRIVRKHTKRDILQESQVMKMAREAQHRKTNSRDYLIWMYQTS